MGVGSKLPIFPYSFKTAGVADLGAIGGGVGGKQIGIELVNPSNFYSCESLYAHFVFLHDGTQAGRNITSVAVQSDATSAPSFSRPLTLNALATALKVDVGINLTSLRNTTGRNVVMFTFDGQVSGTIKLLKLDMMYQVEGIR